MNLLVIGGKLQGTEALYLAQKAGFETLLVDKRPTPPGLKLAQNFIQYEFRPDRPGPDLETQPDLVLPALEDTPALKAIQAWALEKNLPLAFDLKAFGITTSKQASDTLFQTLSLPAPRPWPHCQFPVVAKPNSASGSEGVAILHTPEALKAHCEPQHHWVIQEYLEGPSYSIEILGTPGNYHPLQVTEIHMDDQYDCNCVTTPVPLPLKQVKKFEKMAITLAEELKLKGIMDLEVILHKGKLKLLEIDARLPSQTPMAVYWSSGVNMVDLLAQSLTGPSQPPAPQEPVPSLVEHVQVSPFKIQVLGEHIMATAGPLIPIKDFFGANEALTTYAPGKTHWVATLIFTAPNAQALEQKRRDCHGRIRHLNIH